MLRSVVINLNAESQWLSVRDAVDRDRIWRDWYVTSCRSCFILWTTLDRCQVRDTFS